MLVQNNQDNSSWREEADYEAEKWTYNQGIDGEMIHRIWEKAGSKAEFYDLCYEKLKCHPVCDYTPEMEEIICSIFDSEPRQITII